MRLLRNLSLLALGMVVVAAGAYAARKGASSQLPDNPNEANEPMAPDFNGAVGWINTDHPIKISDLRGRVVLLDFWTYGCINCMHVLPVLRQLEAKREGQPLEIVGVHSAKFENEKAVDHVRAAVERYGITHPVAVDSEMAIWEQYGVQAWPTIVVIRPDGHVAGAIPGEVTFDQLDSVVQKVIDEAKAGGTLASGPALPHRKAPAETGELSYPGKILVAPDGRLFIADSRHHRVVITAPDGRILDVAGSGTQGRKDGSFEAAEFDDPQGMALDGSTLYLADARGYAILALDLVKRDVRTIAGTGRLGSAPLGRPVHAASASLRSPWDLLLRGDQLMVAMAGSHQIGVVDLKKGTIAAFAGNGREAIRDGPPEEASFAQPSGLSASATTLYVADSESSGVRTIDLKTRATTTLLGTGLFDWGDREGPIGPKMIQHPLAVAFSSGGLWIADTYNSKIKRLSPGDTLLTTVLTQAAGKPLLEPGGLAVDKDGSLLITDTGNSRILRLLPGGINAQVVPVGKREQAPALAVDKGGAVPAPVPAADARHLTASVRRGDQTLQLALVAPQGFAFSDGAPWSIQWSQSHATLASSRSAGEAQTGARVPFALETNVESAGGELTAHVRANVCDAVNHSACYPVKDDFVIALEDGAAGVEEEIALPLSAPEHPVTK